MEKDREDILWIDEILKGKTESFAFVVDKYKDRVFSLAMGMLKNRQEAEEVAQDVFVKIFKALPKFQRKAKFSTWMYRIAYNECISYLRKNKVKTVSVDNVPQPDLDATRYKDEEWQERERRSQMLHQVLNLLPEAERGLIHFFYFDNLPVNEIARVTGISTSNVKTKLFRIRKKLHGELLVLKDREIA